jgi:hypothetical protein
MTRQKLASFIDSDMPTRFLFDPPRRPKPKTDPHIESLLVRCPSTSKLTDTGQTIEEKRWRTARIKNTEVHLRALRLRPYLDKGGRCFRMGDTMSR